ncbi:SMI1/KNR4 family protein [Streptacidiphilus sp. P02-A3a]|uniref:SMI1/KNR4 family protein n=1 Tax=Streptacidiphilus sp. P02-A3a TaxID=2704468 RepID=UPI001CDBBD98|nr:SMI1/KNR4 family protein [Streptacidiphilus sp. P02-A3a]
MADQVRGLSDDEIHRIECDQSAPLGAAYRCFLKLIGGGAGHFMQGSDVFYPEIIGLGEAARDLLAENAVPFDLAESDRVILMHQGYQFDFLRGTGPDPEVWSYYESVGPGDTPTLSFPRFTDWLQVHVTQQTEAWARLVPQHEAEKRKKSGRRRVHFSRRHADGSVGDEL